mmetsp:Transcript_75677/g.244878  ORF Transcript_75677/g.244878 Transcript_75677/m.244878 type:complete len:359 (+) Transcript_75677:122-1198(+)
MRRSARSVVQLMPVALHLHKGYRMVVGEHLPLVDLDKSQALIPAARVVVELHDAEPQVPRDARAGALEVAQELAEEHPADAAAAVLWQHHHVVDAREGAVLLLASVRLEAVGLSAPIAVVAGAGDVAHDLADVRGLRVQDEHASAQGLLDALAEAEHAEPLLLLQVREDRPVERLVRTGQAALAARDAADGDEVVLRGDADPVAAGALHRASVFAPRVVRARALVSEPEGSAVLLQVKAKGADDRSAAHFELRLVPAVLLLLQDAEGEGPPVLELPVHAEVTPLGLAHVVLVAGPLAEDPGAHELQAGLPAQGLADQGAHGVAHAPLQDGAHGGARVGEVARRALRPGGLHRLQIGVH